MRIVLALVLITLAACAPRGQLVDAPDTGLPARSIFIGTSRAEVVDQSLPQAFDRSETLTRLRYDITQPPARKPGTITFPVPGRAPDPQTDFLVAARDHYPSARAFRDDLRRDLARRGGKAIVFVHGYNTNFPEGVLRLAQLGADFEMTETLVHYSWPSRGSVLGYAYDRDSALFARDGLAELLSELRAAGAREILVVGHSMGAALTMETLRQLALARKTDTLSALSGVVLISPDIDVDVFRAQAHAVGRLPQPFFIFTSQKDRALGLSARISGDTNRLGNLTDVKQVADLKVTMIDVGAFDVNDGHFNVGDSPALIKMLTQIRRVATVLEGEQAGRSDLFSGVVLSVQSATQIILTPVEALAN